MRIRASFAAAYVAGPGLKYYCFPLAYSRRREIRSRQSEPSARYFRRVEMVAHAGLLERYSQEYPVADRPAVPDLCFQPELVEVPLSFGATS
jgi:hypothetical protein